MVYLHIEVFYAYHSEIDEQFREQANLKSQVKMESFKKALISRLNKNNGGFAKIMISFLAREEGGEEREGGGDGDAGMDITEGEKDKNI